MILLDTNVLIYAGDRGSPFHSWAVDMVADAASGDGAAINAVVLAEICVGDREPEVVADRIRSWGVAILDLPAAVAPVCAEAYRSYRRRRMEDSGKESPRVPLPDFFIGAHAQVMGWTVATADPGRLKTYFPGVGLETP